MDYYLFFKRRGFWTAIVILVEVVFQLRGMLRESTTTSKTPSLFATTTAEVASLFGVSDIIFSNISLVGSAQREEPGGGGGGIGTGGGGPPRSTPIKNTATNTTTGTTRATAAATNATATTTTNATAAKNDTTLLFPPPPRPHPRAGARYSNGSWGYVADVTRVRAWMLERYSNQSARQRTTTFQRRREQQRQLELRSYLPLLSGKKFNNETGEVCQVPPGYGYEGKAGWGLLTEVVVVDGPDPVNVSSGTNTNKNAKERSELSGKILCVVYTYGKNHYRIQGIIETWGWRCDGFFAASTETVDHPSDGGDGVLGYGAIDLPHLGPEKYDNMWQKTRSILGYLYDNYMDNGYEYFFISGDDTYVIVENLRNYLRLLEEKQRQRGESPPNGGPLYLGSAIPATSAGGFSFAGGGPGYVLNKVALKRFVQGRMLRKCFSNGQVSAEDRYLGYCLKKVGIDINDTADDLGKQRFQNMHPAYLAVHKNTTPGRFFRNLYANHWGAKHGVKWGNDIISSQTVSFHILRSQIATKRIHAILYKSCPKGSVLGDALLSTTTTTNARQR